MLLHRPMSRAGIAGLALCGFLTGSGPALADIYYETTYLPTSSILALPSSSLLSTSYVLPTSSTTYLSTSAVYPVSEVYSTSSYIPTYRSVRYRPRRYVERTTYLPTTSYVLEPTTYVLSTSALLPTSYIATSSIAPTSYLVDTGLIATSASSICCESATTPVRSPVTRPSTPSATRSNNDEAIISKPSGSPEASNERRPSGMVDDGVIPSNVVPAVQAPPAAPRSNPAAPTNPALDNRPAETTTPPAPTPAGSGPGEIQIPTPGQINGKPTGDEAVTRSSLRPRSYEVRNVLRGKVVSYESGLPEEGVTVILSSLTRTFSDRPAMTDADGEFKVSLPDGEWTVKVKMPSGSVLAVGRDSLTASNGKVLDGSGRSVKGFVITR